MYACYLLEYLANTRVLKMAADLDADFAMDIDSDAPVTTSARSANLTDASNKNDGTEIVYKAIKGSLEALLRACSPAISSLPCPCPSPFSLLALQLLCMGIIHLEVFNLKALLGES